MKQLTVRLTEHQLDRLVNLLEDALDRAKGSQAQRDAREDLQLFVHLCAQQVSNAPWRSGWHNPPAWAFEQLAKATAGAERVPELERRLKDAQADNKALRSELNKARSPKKPARRARPTLARPTGSAAKRASVARGNASTPARTVGGSAALAKPTSSATTSGPGVGAASVATVPNLPPHAPSAKPLPAAVDGGV